ncbi:3-oxo-tetronate 4-phosphate decarboxylase [Ancylobacter mangrovi]|uniref:3-oxo-tetronate 4-phosphate decarboxylase n=1 Tax=Ancylobacter mangrovi TaxID=2972472 RepID=A0A9X2P9Q2_9HYPH|nr:3-oxo-tetronate 4-phosphate decarboxylase [Ancylobacter mangrovi]MCS0494636.1 aldolase [Ancylobacter mangrovi]MCS0502037.1 aldolase [Ancylobacter mangrovi]
MTDEHELRAAIVKWGASLFQRGLTSGSTGNISVRLDDGFLTTPTNSCLGFLQAERLSKVDETGHPVSGDKPTKELPLHLGFYRSRPKARAVVHLHSTYATALSCLADVDPRDAIPPITPYVVMRVGKVPVLPYVKPGAPLGPQFEIKARDHAAMLIANHGPVVSGKSLEDAVFAAEELEETAKLVLLTRHLKVRRLDEGDVDDLTVSFALR